MNTEIRRIIKKLHQAFQQRGHATKNDLRVVEQIIKTQPRDARLWRLRGIYILMSDEDNKYALGDALKSFKRAIQVDPKYPRGYEEAGYYHWVIRDDPFHALTYFKRAL